MTYQDKSESLANEIEITPEMIEAGVEAFGESIQFEIEARRAVVKIFFTMIAAMQRDYQRQDSE